MSPNYLLMYSEQLATDIELLCQNIKVPSNTLFQIRKSSSSIYANIHSRKRTDFCLYYSLLIFHHSLFPRLFGSFFLHRYLVYVIIILYKCILIRSVNMKNCKRAICIILSLAILVSAVFIIWLSSGIRSLLSQIMRTGLFQPSTRTVNIGSSARTVPIPAMIPI